MNNRTRSLIVFGLAALALTRLAAEPNIKHGSLVTEYITSESLKDNRIGIDPRRSVTVYLPPSYAESKRSYPVVYYFHSFFWSNARMFADGNVQRQIERAMASGVTREFILVAADYSSPTVGSFYENSSTSGRWIDFTMRELVPFVDQHFRTLRHRDSRGVAGEMIGGYAALKFAMLYPEVFSVVYALHPVGTGSGLVPMTDRPDWKKIHAAKSFQELQGDGFSPIFVAMSQAFLPNPDRPPFYCDFMVEPDGGELKPHPLNIQKLKSRFLLDELVREHADSLRSMRAIKFDWGRYDVNQDHVYANQAFTRKLDEYGIEHYAEEYRGGAWDKNWIADGRVYTQLLPFFNQHLVFSSGD